MVKVKFLGRVLPDQTIQVNITTPAVNWNSPDIELEANLTVQIRDSAVEVECEVNRSNPDDFIHLFFRAFDLARASVDLISFSTAIGLSVVLETFVNERGESSRIVPQDARLMRICTAFNLADMGSYDAMWRIVVTNPPLFMALNDLISGLNLPHYGPRVSGQIVETIRGLIAPPGLKPKQQWPYMRQALRIEQDYLTYITDHATGPRHGDRTHISPAITRELAIRAWTIMNRYLELKKRGSAPLPESEFPLLT